MALTYSLVCAKLGLSPGINADESLQQIQKFSRRNPSRKSEIDVAVLYGSKEAMVRWT